MQDKIHLVAEVFAEIKSEARLECRQIDKCKVKGDRDHFCDALLFRQPVNILNRQPALVDCGSVALHAFFRRAEIISEIIHSEGLCTESHADIRCAVNDTFCQIVACAVIILHFAECIFADICKIAAVCQDSIGEAVLIYSLVDRNAACLALNFGTLVAVAVECDMLRRQPDGIAQCIAEIGIRLIEEAVHQVNVEALETGFAEVFNRLFIDRSRAFSAECAEQLFGDSLHAHADSAVAEIIERLNLLRLIRRNDRCGLNAEYRTRFNIEQRIDGFSNAFEIAHRKLCRCAAAEIIADDFFAFENLSVHLHLFQQQTDIFILNAVIGVLQHDVFAEFAALFAERNVDIQRECISLFPFADYKIVNLIPVADPVLHKGMRRQRIRGVCVVVIE